MKELLCALALASSASLAHAQSAYEATTRGSSCTQNAQGNRIGKYDIGSDLRISIAAVGSFAAGISFLRSDITGDFFARMSFQHRCVIVAAVKKAPKEALTALGQFAFISVRTGLVYRTWQQFEAAKLQEEEARMATELPNLSLLLTAQFGSALRAHRFGSAASELLR